MGRLALEEDGDLGGAGDFRMAGVTRAESAGGGDFGGRPGATLDHRFDGHNVFIHKRSLLGVLTHYKNTDVGVGGGVGVRACVLCVCACVLCVCSLF